MREWSFFADRNFDGIVTISDIWLWWKWIFYYPGDFVIHELTSPRRSGIAEFFELSSRDFGQNTSLILSLIAWLTIFNALREMLIGIKKSRSVYSRIELPTTQVQFNEVQFDRSEKPFWIFVIAIFAVSVVLMFLA